jgi:hypothetical protein
VKAALLRVLMLAWVLLAAAAPRAASAFGPLGHRIAGLLAEPALCRAAREEIAALGARESLAHLGLWADTIRGVPEWEHSGPWHYMNVELRDESAPSGEERLERAANGDRPLEALAEDSAAALAAIRAFRPPPEGDVLSAIERFRSELADKSLPAHERAAALKFLVHFVVDVHQPLHVGRAADRGGNTIDVRYGGTVVNLHRFWDTDVLELRRLGPERYARLLRPKLAAAAASSADPAVWAAESLALRSAVYSFASGPRSGAPHALDAAYRAAAQGIVEDRVARGAQRLAATLNGVFCSTAGAERR